MDCRNCQPTLIDLLHGELAVDAADESRAHLAQCASCRSAFEKLSHGMRMAEQLPLLAPPQAVGARLMQLAEEHARSAVALRKPEPHGLVRAWQSLFDFIGRFAMARQVGMATIMLLIVAVGMWLLPQLERAPIADGGTVVNPEPSGEAAPSEGVLPAEPLDLKVDRRAGRIRSKEEQSLIEREEARMAEAAAAQPQTAPVAHAAREQAEAERARSLDDLNAPLDLEVAKSARKARRASEAKPSAIGGKDVALADGYGRADADKAEEVASARPAQRARTSGAVDEARAFPASSAPSAPAAAPAPAAERSAATKAEPEQLAGLLESAPSPSRASGGSATQANAAPSPQATAASAPGKKSKAGPAGDSQRATDCGASLSRYQQIIDGAPGSAQAGEAMLAMARCHNQRGERALARTVLERATSNPHVASRARALLDSPPTAVDALSNPYKR